jgi:hypothetical protein
METFDHRKAGLLACSAAENFCTRSNWCCYTDDITNTKNKSSGLLLILKTQYFLICKTSHCCAFGPFLTTPHAK